MICQGTKKTDIFQGALGREIAPDATARVDHTRPAGLWQRVELHHPPILQQCLPIGIVQKQQARWQGFIDTVHPRPVSHGKTAGFVLILNALPPRQACGGQLVIQLRNDTSVSVTGLEVLYQYVDGGGTQRQQAQNIAGTLAPGKVASIGTGRTSASGTSCAVKLTAARPAD